MKERGITDTKQFTWQLVYNENKNEYDEKENNYNNNKKQNNKQEKLSQLIDVNNNKMCKYGHGTYWMNCEDKCIICGSKKEIKYCYDCYLYAKDKGNHYPDSSDYSYCSDCQIKNGENIQKRIRMNNFKSLIIRNELLKNPSLEMD
eukprot:39553_1